MKQEKDTRKAALARKDHLVVQELPDETLVYDLKRHKAHCLNPTAAFVWDHCDGQTEVPAIAKSLSEELQKPVGEDVIWLALKHLQNANLLQEDVIERGDMARVTRRDVIRRMGVGSAAVFAVPLVTSILAPTAMAAFTPPAACQVCVDVSVDATACPPACNSTVIGACFSSICPTGSLKGNRTCAGCAACNGNNFWTASLTNPVGTSPGCTA